MCAFAQLLPKGTKTKPKRSTEAQVFSVCEGQGHVKIGDEAFRFSPKDVFVAPPWSVVSFDADDDCILFRFSDKTVKDKLGLLREERLSQ